MQRRKFGREFKIEAVRLIKDRGVSVAQASRDLDVHENVLRKWVKELAADPAQAFPGQGQMKPEQLEIERLRREVAKLKAERDILKTYGPPRPQGCRLDGMIGLHQRIRSQGLALAKMDIRASRVLIKATASGAAFRTRISEPPV
jgi:transposase